MDPTEALADLKQISTQIDRAVILRGDRVEASTITSAASAERVGAAGLRLWEAADRAGRDVGRPALQQVEVALTEGSVFAVRHEDRTIVATTGVDPTVGLIFYDLKTCLRQVAEEQESSAGEVPDGGA